MSRDRCLASIQKDTRYFSYAAASVKRSLGSEFFRQRVGERVGVSLGGWVEQMSEYRKTGRALNGPLSLIEGVNPKLTCPRNISRKNFLSGYLLLFVGSPCIGSFISWWLTGRKRLDQRGTCVDFQFSVPPLRFP